MNMAARHTINKKSVTIDHSDLLAYESDKSVVQLGERFQDVLFSDKSLSIFNRMVMRGASIVTKHVANAQAPFSGIRPVELAKAFSDIDLNVPQDSLEHAMAELEQLYLKDAVYFHHPNYLAHLNPPITNVSIMAELIQAAMNTSVDTWDQSGGGTLIEQKIIDWTAERIGFDLAHADGIFTSGGTQSNLMAMLLARDQFCLNHLNGHSIRDQGLPKEFSRFRFFVSEMSHFSLQKASAILGMGYDAVVSIKTDAHYRMDVEALDAAVQACLNEGNIPIAVVATMGTTDFGSIDPIESMSRLCRQHGLWLHADAAYGCGLLVSEKHQSLIAAIHHADSVTLDYHKSFLQPVACGAFLVKDKAHLGCLTYHADYLNPLSQQVEGTPNLVSKSIQTTRRFDALKLWLSLRTLGAHTIGTAFDKAIQLARRVYQQYHRNPNIQCIHSPELSTLVFRYTPRSLSPLNEADLALLDEINITIRKRLARNAEAMIASTKVKGALYLKFTFLNPETTLESVSDVVERIIFIGDELWRNYLKVAQATLNSLSIPQESEAD
ncbi:pyridoxal phosphate-dependent decarboxylase family protein [Marinibactrum halimedae]|uniref:Decarboxylase n=1 Tax=Marinibactrum halimedae TaxID=1444977 RepID=A0AA37WPR1_9GAMM|nr:aspartate aminotransferase family protein [Marinibactrum halimedae]MCD9458590.1 aspartate aminotransferase family protein [Marinibactrum halimedae]GLS26542.1 decarboxylase [Marinibactrum halimedae]